MCVSVKKADFPGTKLYLGEHQHPREGDVRVLCYQNRVVSYAGANAMLLHIPNSHQVSETNFVDTTKFPHIMDDMVDALTPPSLSLGEITRTGGSKTVQVFNVGVYTVVLSEDATSISNALWRVPSEKRPDANPSLFSFYAQAFPGWAIALCCFNNADVREGQPLLMWYHSKEQDFRLPALDCHTGDVPDLRAEVDTSHWLFTYSYRMRTSGMPVRYRDTIPGNVQWMLPDNVNGRFVNKKLQNGDFMFKYNDVLNGNLTTGYREPPPFA